MLLFVMMSTSLDFRLEVNLHLLKRIIAGRQWYDAKVSMAHHLLETLLIDETCASEN